MGALGAACLCGENIATETSNAPAEVPHVVSVVRADARTGRLVRRIVVSPKPEAKATPDPVMVAVIDETAKNLQVSPELVHSVIQVESNYDPYAVSPKGAEGLMQLMPATARRFGVANSFDARQNIEGGVRYLKFLAGHVSGRPAGHRGLQRGRESRHPIWRRAALPGDRKLRGQGRREVQPGQEVGCSGESRKGENRS